MAQKKPLMGEIVTYLKKNFKKGYTQESLRWALLNQNYSKIEVERAMRRANEELANEAPILKTKPEIEHKIISPRGSIARAVKKRKWF